MNNRRKQLMLASAREYCKCVVEGKTLKYNNILQLNNLSGDNYYGMSLSSSSDTRIVQIVGTSNYDDGDPNIYTVYHSFTCVANHKYMAFSTSNIFALMLYNGQHSIYNVGNMITTPDFNGQMDTTIRPYDDNYIASGNNIDETFSCCVIDLTALGLDNITNADQFFATDLGKYIAKGNYLPYEPNGKFIHAQSPINFEGVNIWNEQWENGIWYNGVKYTEGYNAYVCTKDKIKVKPNTYYQYTNVSGKYDPYIGVNFFDKNGNWLHTSGIDNNTAFLTPNNCRYIAFYVNDTYGSTYTHDICINEWNADYNGKYQPYCGGEVLDKGFTFQKGDKYKTYTVEEISYNNLISGIYQDYVNSNADTRASIILSVYDYTNNIGVFAEGISVAGFYEFTFTSNTTTYFGAKIYNSGVSINQNFAENISLTNGHLYYMSLNISSCDASFVGGLRIANLRLIDLTQLGVNNVPQKLGLFLKQNYRLPVSSSNRAIKVQIVRTFKEVDLSSFAWKSVIGVYYVALPKDIKLNGQVIAEKYANDDIWIAEYPYDEMNLIVRTNATPSGKALLELETQEINAWYHLEINDYHDFEQYSGTIYKLDRDLSDLNVFRVTADIGNDMGSLIFLDARGNDNDYCYEDGYIYVKSDDIENAWSFDLLINNLPNRMTSRRIINVESKNGIDLDFSKE